MIDPKQLIHYVIRPVLKDLALWSPEAERLLLGTACVESDCGRYVKQLGGGPALGIYQMEPKTHDDIWNNYLQHRATLMQKVNYWRERWGNGLGPEEMVGNLYYATAMSRIHYLRVPETIPEYLSAQAAYWKRWYNTAAGKGTAHAYMNSWNRFVSPSAFV